MKLTIAFCASAFVFGSAWAQVDNSDKPSPEDKAAVKSQPAPKKDWPTRKEKQDAAAAAARERAERADPKERPLISDVGPPGVSAPDRSRAKPKASTTASTTEKEKEKKSVQNDSASAPERNPAPTGKQ